jgi:hypothetical protein
MVWSGSLKYFFDNNMSPRAACALHELVFPDDEITHLIYDSRLTRASPDMDIIKVLSGDSPRPVWVTADKNQKTKRSPECLALRGSGLTVVFFVKGYGNLNMHQQWLRMFEAWPNIKEATNRCRVPTIFEVRMNGEIEELFPTASLGS